MTTGEKRQAARIIRNLRTPERLIFDCISQLQDGIHEDEAAFDWDGIRLMLSSLRDSVAPCQSLVSNIMGEMETARRLKRKDS